MQDLKLVQDNQGRFDLSISNRKLDAVDGFETAIDFQVFVDRRGSFNDAFNVQDRKGWIADIITRNNSGYQVGSLLWTKYQSRDTPTDRLETLELVKLATDYFNQIGAIISSDFSIMNGVIVGNIQTITDSSNRYSRLWRATNADNN